MSNLLQFTGGIKSIQRGVVSITGTGTTGSATITAVDPAKTDFRVGGVAFTGTPIQLLGGYAALTSATQVTATRGDTGGSAIGTTQVAWELTERY